MAKIIIDGSKRLFGRLKVQGAKNSVLPVLAGTLLCRGECTVHNCPELSDVKTSVKILKHLGCKCTVTGNTAVVDSATVTECDIPDELMREMRSSVVFAGAVIGRVGRAVISSPGGCELGPRPIDLHLSALEKMGVTVTEKHGFLCCTAENGLHGAEINLGFPSVGATENIILAAATAKGTTVIHNAAREPEISDLADFLNSAGAEIHGCGSDTVRIHGVESLKPCEHTVIPDRIAAATYMACVAVTGGGITLENVVPSHMNSVLGLFRKCGCEVAVLNGVVTLSAPERLKRVTLLRSLVYPGFPTDAGPIAVAMLSVAEGTSVFTENIFENRYRYTDELARFGAKIKTEGKTAVIEGVPELSGAVARATDLRGGAALIVAALAAHGKSEIGDIHHIERGYDGITERLKELGAEIRLER